MFSENISSCNPQIVMLDENTGFQTEINDVVHRIFILIKLLQQMDIELTCYDTLVASGESGLRDS